MIATLVPFLLTMIVLDCRSISAQEFDERFTDWPVDLKINGQLIVFESTDDVSPILKLVDRRSKDQNLAVLCSADQSESLKAQYDEGFTSVKVVNEVEGLASIRDQFDAIAFHPADKSNTNDRSTQSQFDLVSSHIQAGGTAIVAGNIATQLGKWYLTNDAPHPSIVSGQNLMPDCVLKLHYSAAKDQRRLLSVLASHPRSVGIGLDSNTALLLSGRKISVSGEGSAMLILTSNNRTPNRIEKIVPRLRNRRQRATDFLADLTEWRRDAIDRTLEPFPPIEPQTPHVPNGTLFIVGGGGVPNGLMEEFVKAAGGKEKARLVYVPCAEQESVSAEQRTVQQWKKMGVQSATFIHTKNRNRANQDEDFYAPLREATGIWFGGGRQWNFADSYYGTTTHKLMKDVLQRGGAIGGSSAGASIQARYLCRATPIENVRPMAPGYERGGLGFISGVAIDQHFAQRRRFRDMTSLVNRHPQLLGIGIDETTAVIVRESNATVVGKGEVHFYDRRVPVIPNQPDYTSLKAGQTYDLAKRKTASDTESEQQ